MVVTPLDSKRVIKFPTGISVPKEIAMKNTIKGYEELKRLKIPVTERMPNMVINGREGLVFERARPITPKEVRKFAGKLKKYVRIAAKNGVYWDSALGNVGIVEKERKLPLLSLFNIKLPPKKKFKIIDTNEVYKTGKGGWIMLAPGENPRKAAEFWMLVKTSEALEGEKNPNLKRARKTFEKRIRRVAKD